MTSRLTSLLRLLAARAPSALAWALGAAGVFVALYVAYAHVASIATAGRYVEEPILERFESSADLGGRFDVSTGGGLSHEIVGRRVRVFGKSEAAGEARYELRSPVRQLTEGTLVMRFRVASAAAYDVMVGVESERSGKGPRAIRFGLQNDVTRAGYAWVGDPLTSISGVGVVSDAPDLLEQERRVAFTEPSEWHEIAVRFSASLHQAFATVDGVPSSSVRTEWYAGLPVRLVFGVRAREAGQAVDVEIEHVAYQPVAKEPQALDFEDSFNGKVVDPRRFQVQQADSFWLDSRARPSPAGLLLEGKAGRMATPHPGVVLHTHTFPLSSVYARARVRVRSILHSGFFLGLTSSLAGAHMRLFDLGFFDDAPRPDGRPRLQPFLAGHWQHNGQSAFERMDQVFEDEELDLEIDYDGKTRTARARVNGHAFAEHTLDLQPREHVRVRFGVNLNEGDAAYELVIRDFRLRALTD